MTNIRYGTTRDARWQAMVTASSVLIVRAGLPDDRVDALWASVAGAAGVQAILDALTRGGISSTPDFALCTLPAEFGGTPAAITVIVRGDLDVVISTSADPVDLTGKGVSTWVEREIPDAVGAQIGAAEYRTRSTSSASFVLNDGSAPVSWLVIGESTTARAPEQVPEPVPVPAPAPAPQRVVDPGATISDASLIVAEPSGESVGGYDFLFGETVVRTVEGAAVREGSADGDVPAGDHDGRTAVGLSAAERRAAREARQKSVSVPVPTAPAFALTFATGEREPLDATLIIGRAPSAAKVSASSVPRLVTVGGPDQDISRNHLQVGVEGGTVIVTDLHSRNGTMITLPGRPPQQLRGGQPTAVISNTLVDLGSGITFTVGEN